MSILPLQIIQITHDMLFIIHTIAVIFIATKWINKCNTIHKSGGQFVNEHSIVHRWCDHLDKSSNKWFTWWSLIKPQKIALCLFWEKKNPTKHSIIICSDSFRLLWFNHAKREKCESYDKKKWTSQSGIGILIWELEKCSIDGNHGLEVNHMSIKWIMKMSSETPVEDRDSMENAVSAIFQHIIS